MISDFQRGSPVTIGELGYVNREWIQKRPSVFQIYGLQSQVTVAYNDVLKCVIVCLSLTPLLNKIQIC